MVAGGTVRSAVLADLAGESAWLDAVLAGLDDAGWLRPTPAPDWTIARQVAHLTWTDDQALCAATDPEAFAIRLTAPDGTIWSWGPADAAQRVEGTALDLCLLATQRRHRSDVGLVATGPGADRWLRIAQAFAGPPGPGRAPAGSGGPA